MCQQLERLEILNILPDDIDQESIFNRAIDVRSSSMLYLAVNIHHDATRFGNLGINLFISTNGR